MTVSTVPAALPGVNPTGPYSTSQELASPTSVQVRVMLVGVTPVAVTSMGLGQFGIGSTRMLSTLPAL